MTDWKPGDLCQVRRGKKWADAEVVSASDPMNDPLYGTRVSVDGRLRWVENKDIRPRQAKRGKLPEPGSGAWTLANFPTLSAKTSRDLLSQFEEDEPITTTESEARSLLKPVPKPTTPRDEDYLAHVRRHPCCSCGTTENICAHHVAGGGMGAKCSDYLTAPLCATCHSWWHAKAELPSMASPHPLGVDAAKAVMWEFAARCLEEWVRR